MSILIGIFFILPLIILLNTLDHKKIFRSTFICLAYLLAAIWLISTPGPQQKIFYWIIGSIIFFIITFILSLAGIYFKKIFMLVGIILLIFKIANIGYFSWWWVIGVFSWIPTSFILLTVYAVILNVIGDFFIALKKEKAS